MTTTPRALHIFSPYQNSTYKFSSHSKPQNEVLPPPFEFYQTHCDNHSSPSLKFTAKLSSILRKSLIYHEPITLSPIKVNLITHPLHRDLSISHINKLTQSLLQSGYENFAPGRHDNPPIAIKYNKKVEITKPLGLGQPPSAHTLVPEIESVPVYYVIGGASRVEAVEYALQIAPNNQNLINLLIGGQNYLELSNKNNVAPTSEEASRLKNYNTLDNFDGGIKFYVLDGSELSIDEVIYLSENLDTRSHHNTFDAIDLQDAINRRNESFSRSFCHLPALTRREDLIQKLDRIISKARRILSDQRIEEVTIDQITQESPPFYTNENVKECYSTSSSSSNINSSSMNWLIWLADLFCPYFRNGVQFDSNQHKYAIPGILFPNFATQIRLIFRDHISFELAQKINSETLGKGFHLLISTCIPALNSIFKQAELVLDTPSIDTIKQGKNWKPTNFIPLLRLNTSKLIRENVTKTWESLSTDTSSEILSHLFQYPSLQGIFHTIGAACVAYFYSIMVHQDESLISAKGFEDFGKRATDFLSKLNQLAFKCIASSINLVQCNENYRLRILEASSLLLRFALRTQPSLNARRWGPFPKPIWTSPHTKAKPNLPDLSVQNSWITFSSWENVEEYIYNDLLLNIIIIAPHLLLSSTNSKELQLDATASWLEKKKPEVMTVVTYLLDSAHRSKYNPRMGKVIRCDPENNKNYELKIIDASVLPMCRGALSEFINSVIPISTRLLNQFGTEWTIPTTATSDKTTILPAFIPILAALRICCTFIPSQFDRLAPESVDWTEVRGKLAHWMYRQSIPYIIKSLQNLEALKDSMVIFSMAKDPRFELKPVDMELIFEEMRYEIHKLLGLIESTCFVEYKSTIDSFWQGPAGIRFLYPKVSKVLSKLTNYAEPIVINNTQQIPLHLKKNEPLERIKSNLPNHNKTQVSESPYSSELFINSDALKVNLENNYSTSASDNENRKTSEQIVKNATDASILSHNLVDLTNKINLQDYVKLIISNQRAKNSELSSEERCSNLFEEWFRHLPLNHKLLLQREVPHMLLADGNASDLPDLMKWKPPIIGNDCFRLKNYPEDNDNNLDETSNLSHIDWKIITAALEILRSRGIDTLYSTSKNISFYLGDTNHKNYDPLTSKNFQTISPDNQRPESVSNFSNDAPDIEFSPLGDLPPILEASDNRLWMSSNLKLFLNGIYPESNDERHHLLETKNNKRKIENESADLKDLLLSGDGPIPQSTNQEFDSKRKSKQLRSKDEQRHVDISLRTAIANHISEVSRDKELVDKLLKSPKNPFPKEPNESFTFSSDSHPKREATYRFSPYPPSSLQ